MGLSFANTVDRTAATGRWHDRRWPGPAPTAAKCTQCNPAPPHPVLARRLVVCGATCGRYGPAPRPVRRRDLHGALRTAGPATCRMIGSSAARTAPREVWHSAPRTGSGCTRVRAALPTNRPRTATREVWHSAPRTGKQLYPSAGSPPDEPAALPTNRLAGWPPAVVHTWVDLQVPESTFRGFA